jgi:glucokinase
MTLAIGVDVGGTKVAAGVVDEDGQILAKLKRSTPAASPARTEQAIADVVTELLAGHQVEAIGSGRLGSSTAPGPPCCSRPTWPGATSR